MDAPTRSLGEYVREKGINIANMAKKTGISYCVLYDSLMHKGRERDLRVGEFVAICDFLGKDPRDFMDKADKQAG